MSCKLQRSIYIYFSLEFFISKFLINQVQILVLYKWHERPPLKLFILNLPYVWLFYKNFANVNSFKSHSTSVTYITNILRNMLICTVPPMRGILILSRETEEQRCYVICTGSPSWWVGELGFKSRWTMLSSVKT